MREKSLKLYFGGFDYKHFGLKSIDLTVIG